MVRRGVTIGVAMIVLLLAFFAASLLFNRTNPGRESHVIEVYQSLSSFSGR